MGLGGSLGRGAFPDEQILGAEREGDFQVGAQSGERAFGIGEGLEIFFPHRIEAAHGDSERLPMLHDQAAQFIGPGAAQMIFPEFDAGEARAAKCCQRHFHRIIFEGDGAASHISIPTDAAAWRICSHVLSSSGMPFLRRSSTRLASGSPGSSTSLDPGAGGEDFTYSRSSCINASNCSGVRKAPGSMAIKARPLPAWSFTVGEPPSRPLMISTSSESANPR